MGKQLLFLGVRKVRVNTGVAVDRANYYRDTEPIVDVTIVTVFFVAGRQSRVLLYKILY